MNTLKVSLSLCQIVDVNARQLFHCRVTAISACIFAILQVASRKRSLINKKSQRLCFRRKIRQLKTLLRNIHTCPCFVRDSSIERESNICSLKFKSFLRLCILHGRCTG